MRGNSGNLAAAAAGWSARHRRKAILGWLAFVLIAFVGGSAIGQRCRMRQPAGRGRLGGVERWGSGSCMRNRNPIVRDGGEPG
jgi:hypothetical protein